MVATPSLSGAMSGRPRPLNLNRDIPQVMALLDLVFRPTLQADEQQARRGNLTLHSQPGFVLRLSQLATGIAPGFVWEEAGKIIGNVSLLSSKQAGRYLIANVAVHPDFRRRGIARSLLETALTHLRQRQGRQVLLQVENINFSAKHLYEELGFVALGDVITWYLPSSRYRELPVHDARDIRQLDGSAWRAAYALDQAFMPPDLYWPDPVGPELYQQNLWRRLGNFLNGQQVEAWAALDDEGKLVGTALIRSEFGQPHELFLRVAPAGQGQWERPLLAKLMRRLRYLRRRHIKMVHPAADEWTQALLMEAGFQNRRTLTTMKLQL
ncbi:MAG: GNAT family N-acetyltransferase [Anaerolineales bacterium]|nr:GNAT family N-acetyltransferase [Anaerolineales bacterium]